MGCSYGGIETVFAAERGAGYRVAVAISPGAESWEGNKLLQARMIKAVDGIKMPILIIQPSADTSLEPGKVLGAELQRLGQPYQLKIFPPSGTPALDGHCFGGAAGGKIWAPDALAFIAGVLAKP
jgi:hypothetical protein